MKGTHITRLCFAIGLIACGAIVLGISADIETIVSGVIATCRAFQCNCLTCTVVCHDSAAQ